MNESEWDLAVICKHDWANAGASLKHAAESIGLKVIGRKLHSHGFRYPNELEIGGLTQLREMAQEASVVLFMHSQRFKLLVKKRQAVFHGGTAYRKNQAGENRYWNERVCATFIQTWDLWNSGAKNPFNLVPPVSAEFATPGKFGRGKVLTVGHYPRGVNKGTAVILKAIQQAPGTKLLTSKRAVPWDKHIDRVRECDVYVESLSQVGHWGTSALEAATMGRVVITTMLPQYYEQYRQAYGIRCPLLIANNRGDVTKHLVRLAALSNKEFKALQEKIQAWALDVHGMKPTGTRLASALELT